jgi:antitoxin StbD
MRNVQIRTDFSTVFTVNEVVTTGEAREALHRIAREFDAGEGKPVYFGSHRRAQAVIVPVDVWEHLLEQVEDELDVEVARERLASGSPRLTHDEVVAVVDRLRAGRTG